MNRNYHSLQKKKKKIKALTFKTLERKYQPMNISFKELLLHISKIISVQKPTYANTEDRRRLQGINCHVGQSKPLSHMINSDRNFVTRTEANEGAAKACLDWLEWEHQVAVQGLYYELMEKKGMDFICLLDLMVSTAPRNCKFERWYQKVADGKRGDEREKIAYKGNKIGCKDSKGSWHFEIEWFKFWTPLLKYIVRSISFWIINFWTIRTTKDVG